MIRLLLILLSLLISFQIFPFSLKIGKVEIFGNRKVSKQKILLLLKSRPGAEYNEEFLKEDIKRISQTGYFSSVSYQIEEKEGKVFIKIFLKENPVIERIKFKGNRYIREKRLRDLLGIKEGEIFRVQKVKEGIEKIKKEYEKENFLFTDIDYEKEIKDGKLYLTVKIKEGFRAYVGKIIFEGNKHFSSRKLKKLMKIKERKMPFRKGSFKKEIFEKDLEKIKEFYHRNGFLQAEIVDAKIIPAGKRINLKIKIFEGKRYYLGKIYFKGKKIFDEKVLRSLLVLKNEGEVFDEKKSNMNLKKIEEFYFDRGYIKAKVVPIPEIVPPSKINITYLIKPGNIFYIKEVKIKGNTKTKDKVIRREIELLPGDKFSGKKIKESFNNLRDLNYFEVINIYPEFTDEPNMVNLVVEVKEKEKTGLFMIGGGYSSIEKLCGFVSIEQSNFDITNPPSFVGGGQNLKLWVQVGSKSSGFNLSFTEPYFLDKPVWFGPDIYNFTTSWEDYSEKRFGGDIRIGRRWKNFSIGFKALSESVKLFDVEIPSIVSEEGKRRKNSLTTTFNFFKIDSLRFPTKGVNTEISLEYAGGIFGGDLNFIKTTFEGNYYHPFKKLIFHSKTYLGSIHNFGDVDIPIYERFFGGGIGTVRGYEERSLGPKEDGYPIGGNVIFAQSLELFYPIYKDVLKGVVFFDAGNVWKKWKEFGSLKKGVGAGLRIYTPIFSAPIQIDYGFALDREPGQDRGRLHIGMSFGF